MRAVGAVEQRVAVGRRARDDFRAHVAAGAGPVVDDDRRAERLRDPRHDDAGERVRAAAGRKRHDEPDRPVGIVGCRDRKDRRAGRADDDADQPSREAPREACFMWPAVGCRFVGGNVGRGIGRSPRRYAGHTQPRPFRAFYPCRTAALLTKVEVRQSAGLRARRSAPDAATTRPPRSRRADVARAGPVPLRCGTAHNPVPANGRPRCATATSPTSARPSTGSAPTASTRPSA